MIHAYAVILACRSTEITSKSRIFLISSTPRSVLQKDSRQAGMTESL
jgi:hypothetical protein